MATILAPTDASLGSAVADESNTFSLIRTELYRPQVTEILVVRACIIFHAAYYH